MVISLAASKLPRVGARANLQLLFADPCRSSRRMTHDMLQRLSIEATLVDNGEQAVHLAIEGRFDVILMNVDMPVMDGIVATARIREFESRSPLRRRVPVVGYIATDRAKAEPILLRIGMDAVLEKPCGILSMSSCLQRVCPAEPARLQC